MTAKRKSRQRQEPTQEVKPQPRIRRGTWLTLLGASVIVLATLIAYAPAMHGDYVWDDDFYLVSNPLITAADGLRRIWFSLDSPSQYFPLVYTTFRLEHALWDLDPFGYHLVNIFLHIINALLVWHLLRRLSVPGAWLAGAIFALHPVHVESVAWITERKNVLSTLFYLLAILSWLRFTDKSTPRPWRYYPLTAVLQALALFAKTTACTLPAALLIVLWLKKERIGWRRIIQVIPFLAMGAAMGMVSVWWEQHRQGTKGAEFTFSLAERVLIASRALWFYVGKLVWPSRLAFSYTQWKIDSGDPAQYIWLVGCVCVGLGLWIWRRRLGRGPIAAVIFFVAVLSPVLGFISLYTFLYSFVADHYQYVASIGLIALFSAVVVGKLGTSRSLRQVQAFPFVILVVLGFLTWKQAHVYADMETLWRDSLAKNPTSWMVHNNLGLSLYRQGKFDEAVSHYRDALRLRPDRAEAYTNWGNVLLSQGRLDEAIARYSQALRNKPDYALAHFNLGFVLSNQGRDKEALAHLLEGLRISPDDANAHFVVGMILDREGKTDGAIRHYREALKINPNQAEAHNNLGMILSRQGKIGEALAEFFKAVRCNPNHANAHQNLAVVLVQKGRLDEAIVHFQEAVRIEPSYGMAHYNLATALFSKGRYAETWREVLLCRKHGYVPDPRFLQALSEKMPEPRE